MLKRFQRRLLIGGAAVVLIGAAGVMGAARWLALTPEAAPPYVYQAAAQGPSDAATELAELVPGTTASSLVLQAIAPDRTAAKAEIVTLPDGGEAIVGWTSSMPEPILRSDISAHEELALVAALRKHLPEHSTILAMPSLSARLAHFVAADYPLAGALGQEGLRIPAPWTGQRASVVAAEQRWTGAGEAGIGAFGEFIDALLAEDVYGAARLQALAGPNDSYIIVHVRDVFDLGITTPERILVAQRDFPAAGLAHDKSRAVKDWAATQDFVAYAVERREGGAIRAYFLGDAKDKSTLLGQLLPFNTANIGQVAGTTLVFQTGGYWVYQLESITERTH